MLLRLCLVAALVAVAASQSRLRPRQQQRVQFPQTSTDRFGRRTTTTTTTSTTTTPATKTSEGTLLVPPIPEKCATRPKHWKLGRNWYFYSADEAEFQETDPESGELVGKRYDWLDARNLCRRYCMDSINIESEAEWEMVKGNVTDREHSFSATPLSAEVIVMRLSVVVEKIR
ncbi:uncharacterized protein LOC119110578 [Pollicipes pollicipes]|uniref:uncharacterized protein LOC119110578 n=1 Tax=Pollicipes pollicipes TaxID=41117 RepID=UPI0018858171|nr:uncharacterized protein LOC119110578 [Pollicipes pollicipes]